MLVLKGSKPSSSFLKCDDAMFSISVCRDNAYHTTTLLRHVCSIYTDEARYMPPMLDPEPTADMAGCRAMIAGRAPESQQECFTYSSLLMIEKICDWNLFRKNN
jgi:hypothetical protein